MKIDILTLFPEMFEGPFSESILRRAQDKSLIEINIYNLRDWANDKHKTVDDKPYGGGAGMVLKVDVIDKALQELKNKETKRQGNKKTKKQRDTSTINHRPLTILLSAKGKLFTQEIAYTYSKLDHLILIAGHYEGVDERVAKYLVDEEISIGNYVLTGGEIPAMVIVDTVVRLIPGVINPDSLAEESFHNHHATVCGSYEYSQYTRPEIYKGWKVPEVLLSGNHKEIQDWRKKESKSIKK